MKLFFLFLSSCSAVDKGDKQKYISECMAAYKEEIVAEYKRKPKQFEIERMVDFCSAEYLDDLNWENPPVPMYLPK